VTHVQEGGRQIAHGVWHQSRAVLALAIMVAFSDGLGMTPRGILYKALH
jgi:hypothetical protein